ncbi:MAG: hypothetical protein ACI4GW_08620 [Lachnospiraceae bacterium]
MNVKKITLLAVILTIILWIVTAVVSINSLSGAVILLLFAIAASILSFCMICVWLIRKIKPGISSYKLFGITDVVVEGIIVIYAVYDILTDTGIMAGIAGFLILCFVAPVPLIFLIIDIILYFRNKKDKMTFSAEDNV